MKTFASFAGRITRGYVVLACALILLVVLASTLLAFLLFAGTLNEAVTETAQRAADLAAQERAAHRTPAQTAAAIASRFSHGRVQIIVFDDRHRLLAGRPEPPSFAQLVLRSLGQIAGVGRKRVAIAGGVVVVEPDLSRFLSLLGWYWSIMLPVGVVAVLLAWLAGRGITRRALDPLERVTASLRGIAGGDFEPEPLANGATDLSALTSAYNAVAHRLTAATAERQKNEARMRQFIADAGHELRTPLTVIMGYLDVLEKGAVRDEESVARIHATMLDESRRMRALIEKLILLARFERPPAVVAADVDVGAVARRAVEALAPVAGGRILLHAADRAVTRGDESELYEAIKNVVDNAVKYAPESPVDVGVARDDGTVLVTVSDRGPGIDPADLPHIFERFYRGDGKYEIEGSGLGMAIAKSAVERFGGSIAVESAKGEGTRVTMRFPRPPA
ncbi:MAG TPA: HAMP domain-containing sensor histidine kinase [Candidatus Tyrphobacter sp.]